MKWNSKRLGWLVVLAQLPVLQALAQEEIERVQQKNEAGQIEEFGVLKADKAVRQGPYIRYRMSGPMTGVVYEAGTYEHGLKQGEWRSFSEQQATNRLVSRGTYLAGVPAGPWVYYHESGAAPVRKMVFDPGRLGTSFIIASDDTTATVQAKGFCLDGARAGLWKYYDAKGKLVQAINHSASPAQLLYWQPATGPAVSGALVQANHGVLYVGGKEQLQRDLAGAFDVEFWRTSGKTADTGVVFSVDSTGRQTGIGLTTKTVPTKYEQQVLMQLGKVPTLWLPRVSNGHASAASYFVLINSVITDAAKTLTVESFGE
ncbi:toxin-antitoxin system YwqK family antitoxin [Hymenobacter negativus]|uniref:WG repeat-containing protein n=1 Tax=Hymenobacter negativus TaxID=2795026 RepID=A0ABS3QL55_9BACT|nr:hypothetical protein [Hymenobacter negativus]MBO2011708.1 hypothetical protein [Hymenobacter negativus]